MNSMLSFIHLSDIHFRKYSGDPYDIDEDLRKELLYDISDHLPGHISSVDGILICGDIAYSGQEKEYEVASAFLDKICESLGLDKSHIFCVPGNHDVDQGVTKGYLSVRLLQSELEKAESIAKYDDCLASIFRTPRDAEIIYAPIACYNEKFAAQYGCSLTQQPTWIQTMQLNEKYKLCLIGINSTIISNEQDHRPDGTERPMRISHMQIPQREDNTIYLSLCHHPPECWIDPGSKLSKKMNDRVTLQLYGHKHLQVIQKTEKGLIVGSGATHPSRLEDEWIPRYNWITLEVKEIETEVTLEIRIYPRVLDDIENRFVPDRTLRDNKQYFEFNINLMEQNIDCTDKKSTYGETESSTLSVCSWEREFIYSFMNLPFFRRELILKTLELGRPEDEGKKHIELLDRIIERAKEQDCISKLMEALNAERERMGKL